MLHGSHPSVDNRLFTFMALRVLLFVVRNRNVNVRVTDFYDVDKPGSRF